MPRDSAGPLLTVAQAATLLGVHPNTLRGWTDAGRLSAYRIKARGDRRFRREDVMRLLVEDGAVKPTSDASAAPRPAELAIFGRIATALATTPTAGAVGRAVVEALRADLGVERAAIYAGGGDELTLAAHAGFDPAPADTIPAPAEGTTELDGNAALRLRTRRGIVGLLVLDPASAAAMTPELSRSLTATLATSLASAALIGRARREIKRARALRSVVKELSGTLELGDVLGDIVELTRSLFGADKAGLWLVEAGEHPFNLAAQHDLSPAFLERVSALPRDGHTPGQRAIRDRRAVTAVRDERATFGGQLRDLYVVDGIAAACLVPLIAGNEVLGVLGLYHAHERVWPDEEVGLAQAFADQAAVAIQNARLYRSVAAQAARMQSIQDLSARLNRLTDVRAIAQAIVAEAETLADYHDIRVYAVDWDRRVCDPIAFTREMLDGDPEDAEALLRVEIGEGFTGWVAEHGEALLVNDAVDDERGKTIDGTEDIPESMLVVPMLYEGRALGVIVLSQLGYNRFTDDDLRTMSIFAGYAAQAMANATTYEQLLAQSTELERRADSQRRLLETNERLLSTLDQADVLETIADGLRDVVAYDNLSIYRADHTARMMHPVLTRERHADEVSRYVIPFGRGLMGWAIEHMQPILANDALSDPRALQIPGTPADPEAVVVVPLMADGHVLGALNVSRVGGPEVYFSDSDFELVQLFAAQASIALRNADEHHAISKLVDTDALTGLANHGAFQRDLAAHVERAQADGSRFSVLMMDLDRFKAYNDRHGHPAGDDLLHRIAMAIHGAARSDDRVYRYGGDEFALLLPDATSEQAARAGNRICRAVADLMPDDPSQVTITIGVAAYPEDTTDRAGLIAAADGALYYGKRAGRNRVHRAGSLAAEVGDLRGTLEEIASAALLEDDGHGVEELVERARLAAPAPSHESVRDALLTVARALDAEGVPGRGQLDRVGRLAHEIAEQLDVGADAERCIELAARLRLLDEDGVAELAPIASLRNVADIIGGYRWLRAGGRDPKAADSPLGSHVIAVAAAFDELTTGGPEDGIGRAEAIERLAGARKLHRPEVVAALAAVVGHRPDIGRRRRRGDPPGEARGAA